MDTKYKMFICAAIPLVIALISIFAVSKAATSTASYTKTIEALDENKKNVLELMTGSTAASAAITMLPGDVATPIAEELADISSDFIIVLSAIYLEKFLLTVIGFVAFVLLIPVGCVVISVNIFLQKPLLWVIARKLLIFGCIIVLVIPTSVKISSMINDTYGASISETIDNAKQATDEVEQETEESAGEDEQSWLGGLISSAKNSVTSATKNMERVLNNMVDALAILIVTSCVIPVLVIIFFFWLAKVILNVEVPLPSAEGLKRLPWKK